MIQRTQRFSAFAAVAVAIGLCAGFTGPGLSRVEAGAQVSPIPLPVVKVVGGGTEPTVVPLYTTVPHQPRVVGYPCPIGLAVMRPAVLGPASIEIPPNDHGIYNCAVYQYKASQPNEAVTIDFWVTNADTFFLHSDLALPQCDVLSYNPQYLRCYWPAIPDYTWDIVLILGVLSERSTCVVPVVVRLYVLKLGDLEPTQYDIGQRWGDVCRFLPGVQR